MNLLLPALAGPGLGAPGGAARLPAPGPACGPYPERPSPGLAGERLPRGAGLRAALDRLQAGPWRLSHRRFVAAVQRERAVLPPAGSAAFGATLRELRAQLGARGFEPVLLARCLALLSAQCEATLGRCPWDTQLVAARILLDNRLAEMATGEGKTLAAMLAAATAALAGVPVHVVTANPYLAGRDAQQLGPFYAALGLRVTALRADDDAAVRRDAYRHDIVYATASDLIFDYLRDRATRATGGEPLLRGLCMALVDEADSVLIDEARTPFILAVEHHDAAAARRHALALALAATLQTGLHYRLEAAHRRARLQPAGQRELVARLAAAAADGAVIDPLWSNRRFAEELVEQALVALQLMRRDEHYLVDAVQGVQIVDATTGRVAQGRRWSHGLHQMIELKEGLAPSPLQTTCAQLTYQRFFPRYWRLCGMSGTLREARTELRQVYALAVETVPLRRADRRRRHPLRLYRDAAARWDAVQQQVAALHAEGAAVLVGTDSVADAQALSARLQAAGIAHQRLDARQDADEAACVARAGQAGSVTVTTNMAGRGTDIALGPGVAEGGGLQLLACQFNASARIDRQLHGRCARAGDPGAVHTLLALDEGLLAQRLPRWALAALQRLARPRGGERAATLPPWLGRLLLHVVQQHEERRARRQREQLLLADRRTLRGLGFGGAAE